MMKKQKMLIPHSNMVVPKVRTQLAALESRAGVKSGVASSAARGPQSRSLSYSDDVSLVVER